MPPSTPDSAEPETLELVARVNGEMPQVASRPLIIEKYNLKKS